MQRRRRFANGMNMWGERMTRQNFPTLTPEHLRAAVAFAASSAQEDLPVPNAPPV
jgi:hypothetical protein